MFLQVKKKKNVHMLFFPRGCNVRLLQTLSTALCLYLCRGCHREGGAKGVLLEQATCYTLNTGVKCDMFKK